MRIAFYTRTIPFNDQTLETQPLGGTETGAVRLARELKALGHEVVVFTTDANPPLSNPLYVPVAALGDLGRVDLFVGIRDWNFLFLPIDARLKMLWTGDSPLQPFTRGLGDKRVSEHVDTLLAVSEWHALNLCEASGFPRSKAWVIGNGIEPSYFEGEELRVRKRLFYSSLPYRGLQLMPEILPRIIAAHPDVEFHSFSGFKVYQDLVADGDKIEFDRTVSALSRFTQFHNHGNVPQAELAREMMKSSILCYPNTFEETSCITAIEAQAAGCAVVTSALGALSETVGDAGILIKGEPGSPEYINLFVDAVNTLLSDDGKLDAYADAAKRQAQGFSWAAIAARFSEYAESKL
jgi:glycosyltransferase involved in cell wall biosynthesis